MDAPTSGGLNMRSYIRDGFLGRSAGRLRGTVTALRGEALIRIRRPEFHVERVLKSVALAAEPCWHATRHVSGMSGRVLCSQSEDVRHSQDTTAHIIARTACWNVDDQCSWEHVEAWLYCSSELPFFLQALLISRARCSQRGRGLGQWLRFA